MRETHYATGVVAVGGRLDPTDRIHRGRGCNVERACATFARQGSKGVSEDIPIQTAVEHPSEGGVTNTLEFTTGTRFGKRWTGWKIIDAPMLGALGNAPLT